MHYYAKVTVGICDYVPIISYYLKLCLSFFFLILAVIYEHQRKITQW